MAPSMDPYAVLELQKGCNEAEISKAYKKQCLKWHPDKNRDNEEEAKQKFILARQALELLSDKGRREEYDSKREGERVRDEKQRERMEKSDGKRRKDIEDLLKREKEAEGRLKTTESPPKTAAQLKKAENGSKESFEELARRLESEVNEEMRKQQDYFLREQKKEAAVTTDEITNENTNQKEGEIKDTQDSSGLEGKTLEELQEMFFDGGEPAAKKAKGQGEIEEN